MLVLTPSAEIWSFLGWCVTIVTLYYSLAMCESLLCGTVGVGISWWRGCGWVGGGVCVCNWPGAVWERTKPRINIAADFTFGHSTCDLCILTWLIVRIMWLVVQITWLVVQIMWLVVQIMWLVVQITWLVVQNTWLVVQNTWLVVQNTWLAVQITWLSTDYRGQRLICSYVQGFPINFCAWVRDAQSTILFHV